MKLIDELLNVCPSGQLELIKALSDFKNPVPNSLIREVYNKNAYKVDAQLKMLLEADIIIKGKFPSKVGKSSAIVYFDKYKLNRKNRIIKMLLKEVKDVKG